MLLVDLDIQHTMLLAMIYVSEVTHFLSEIFTSNSICLGPSGTNDGLVVGKRGVDTG